MPFDALISENPGATVVVKNYFHDITAYLLAK